MDRDLQLRSFEIRASESAHVVARFDSASLANPFRQRATYFVESATPSAANLSLGRGRTALVSVEFTVPTADALPAHIQHVVRFAPDSLIAMRRDDGTVSPDLVAISEPIASAHSRIVIGAPVKGGPWRCGNGLAYNNSHSSLYPFRTAVMHVPQRFGCDFSKVDSAGNTLPNPFPDTISNNIFYGYGAPVVAVADGAIAHVTDGIPENIPQANGSIRMAVPLTNETVSGNWISLRIADSIYAFYAHLQPGSIRVREGQRVHRGQVIALLGNAGNAVGPHLHFHVGNRNSLNGGDAVPHVYRSFELLGTVAPATAGVPQRRMNQLLADGAVARFP
ncbi:MAG: M23 family metallopeptidase [Gemmatimonadaceae bacterium]